MSWNRSFFQVPNDIEYHAIAFEPIVDNPNVLHHMMLYGCGDSITSASVRLYSSNIGITPVAALHMSTIMP